MFFRSLLLLSLSLPFSLCAAEWWDTHEDPFLSLSDSDLAAGFSDESATGLKAIIDAIGNKGKGISKGKGTGRGDDEESEPLRLSLTTGVEVRLVGFKGDGNFDLDLDVDQLHRYAELAQHSRPIPVRNGGGVLPIDGKPVFHVSKAPASVMRRIDTAIADAIGPQVEGGHLASEGAFAHVAASKIDAVLRDDFRDNAVSYTIYVINPTVPQHGYLYYDDTDIAELTPEARKARAEKQGKLPRRHRRGPARCGFTVHAARDHYMWIDLTAGPMELGPSTAGDGLVLAQNLPRPSNYATARNPHLVKTDEFFPALASFLRASVDRLVTPPLDRFPVPFSENIDVRLYTIRDHPRGEGGTGSGHAHGNGFAFDWPTIEREVRRLGIRGGQRVTTSSRDMFFESCEACVAAFAHSLKSHTSDVVRSGLRTQVHQYIDSTEMHAWLSHYASMLDGPPGDGTRRVSVFMFDLARTSVLLLDRFHQALPFDDMVIAVRTRAARPLTDFHCNGHMVSLDPNDGTRNVLGAILRTGWGVAPTEISVDPHVGPEDIVNYAFSASNTPFGPFAEAHRSLSFAQVDAAARGSLLTELSLIAGTLGPARTGMARLLKVGGGVVTHEEHTAFVRRWNHAVSQCDSALRYISLHNFQAALKHVAAARHGATALRRIVASGKSRVGAEVKYVRAPATGIWLQALIAFAFLFAVLAWFYRVYLAQGGSRMKIRTN